MPTQPECPSTARGAITCTMAVETGGRKSWRGVRRFRRGRISPFSNTVAPTAISRMHGFGGPPATKVRVPGPAASRPTRAGGRDRLSRPCGRGLQPSGRLTVGVVNRALSIIDSNASFRCVSVRGVVMRTAVSGLVAGCVAVSFLILFPMTADAGGRKSCRPDGHLHHGTSDSQPSKKAAQRAAIASWSSFTDFEYGPSWANFKHARYKSISCMSKESGWSCSVEANPCKGSRQRTARK